MKNIVTFGEMMLRIAPEGFLRCIQAFPGTAQLTYAGAEANVAVSIAILGGNAAFITALPKNDIAEAGITTLRRYGVDTSHIQRVDQGRLGIYFVETGSNQRPSNVVYDRENSSIALMDPKLWDWDNSFKGADWFHVTGITPALSEAAAESTLQAVKAARRAGLTISTDLNFRKKLWRWDASSSPRELAERTMRKILPFIDVVIANESDCADVLGIHAANTNTEAGELDTARYPDVAQKLVDQFPNVKKVAITLRESFSATHNNWSAMLYDAATKKAHFAPVDAAGKLAPYEIKAIVDRVGGGDSFAAGLIYALTDDQYNRDDLAIRFAVASSCLAHTIYGDFNFVRRNEVETLMNGNASGRVQR